MKSSVLFKDIKVNKVFPEGEVEISSICCDSRKCTPGALFIAVAGYDLDGHKFISGAVSAGAVAVAFQDPSCIEEVKGLGVTGFLMDDTRLGMALIAANFYDHPGRKLNLVGVTGTNGKTTIVTLLYRLFTGLGYGCGLLSTIRNYVGRKEYETTNTTRDPITVNALLSEMVEDGCQYCFMEVSSHSLDQNRVAGLDFKGAIFTNITHDHLDYHKTFAEYIRCKKKLFDMMPAGTFSLINADDRNGEIMVQNTISDIYTYSAFRKADFNVKIVEKSLEGSLLKLDGHEVWTRFIGAHNAHNLAAVYGTACLLGADRDEVLRLISGLEAVAGRLDFIRGGDDITAVIDYAHTPDALENVLRTLKEISAGVQVIAVFGCGGNRDRTKRPEMAAIGAKYADRVIITSDNPRFEDPEAIIADMKAGLTSEDLRHTLFITDRKEAIHTALMTSPKGSIVLIAGKGHEDYQIVNGVKSHFDDKEIVAAFFSEAR